MVSMRVGITLSFIAACSGEQKPKRWWQRTAGMRSVSPHCNNMTFSDVMASVDDVHASGATIFSVNAAYDSGSGYDYAGLWCGLAASDLKGVSRAIGSQEQFKQLEEKVHSKGMSLISWMNPSYFWTGSPAFKEAVADVKKYGVGSSKIPATSPALWFRWNKGTLEELDNVVQPKDALDWTGDPPPTGYDYKGWTWVWSPEANASYFSVWGHQPTTDWTSPQWRDYFRTVLSYWIDDMHLDGFVFDFPDGYIGVGSSNSHLSEWQDELWPYSPQFTKQYITDVIHEVGDHRVAAFAELYPDDWSVNRGSDYGFDAIIGDDGGNGGFTRVVNTIQNGNADYLENVFTGEGGPDALRAYCFHANTGDCAIPWTRFLVGTPWFDGAEVTDNSYDCTQSGATYVNASGLMSLEQCFGACADDEHCEAITVGWQTRSPHVEVECHKLGGVSISNCTTAAQACEPCPVPSSTFALDAPLKLRQAVAFTIAGGNLLAVERGADGAWWSNNDWPGRSDPALAKVQQTFEDNVAFSHLSLRAQLPVAEPGHYAMLRYDHAGTGSAAVAAFNFGAEASSVSIDLSLLSRAFGQTPTDLLTGKPAAALEEFYSVEIPAHGVALLGVEGLGVWKQYRTTSCKHGYRQGVMSLDGCLVKCLGSSSCSAVSVQWKSDSYDQVVCKHHSTLPNLSDCDQAAGSDFAAFFLNATVVEWI